MFGDFGFATGEVIEERALAICAASTRSSVHLEIDDIAISSTPAQTSSEISIEVANVRYFGDRSILPNKSRGRVTFADVTFEGGATQDRDLFDCSRTSRSP